jgi:ADP-ribose pyrophosphatase YjhB (NUDIX family)
MASSEVWRPDVTVATVVERDGRFLLVEERVQGRLVHNPPAGHLEPDEGLIEAAVRETLEETAWNVLPVGLVAIYQWVSPADGSAVVRFTFAAQALAQEPDRRLDHGIERALWLSLDEVKQREDELRSPMVLASIHDCRRGRLVPLELLQNLLSARSLDTVP